VPHITERKVPGKRKASAEFTPGGFSAAFPQGMGEPRELRERRGSAEGTSRFSFPPLAYRTARSSAKVSEGLAQSKNASCS